MSLAGVKSVADAYVGGRSHFCSLRKVPSQASVSGWWVDYSMAAGNPAPQYYAASPLEAKTLDGMRGIFHGTPKAPAEKYLTSIGLMTPTAAMVGNYLLCDYVLFYPFIDGDSTDEQAMDNTVVIPRYATEGVQVMAVAVAPTLGGGAFTFTYVNQDGVEKTSPVQYCSASASNIASLLTSQPDAGAGRPAMPFLRLAPGDTGVRSIVSATFTVANGGLMALVLVKPLVSLDVREINTMAELPLISNRVGAPQILDGAYLNFIAQITGSVAAGQLAGYATFVWSD